MNDTQLPRLLKIAEVAGILQVSKTAAYLLVQVGELPAVHIAGKTVRVRLEDLQKYIQEHLVEAR
jgi:excisionase family DNA binding protein